MPGMKDAYLDERKRLLTIIARDVAETSRYLGRDYLDPATHAALMAVISTIAQMTGSEPSTAAYAVDARTLPKIRPRQLVKIFILAPMLT